MSKWAFSAFIDEQNAIKISKGTIEEREERDASSSKDTKDPRTADV